MTQLVCNIGHLIRIGILQFYGDTEAEAGAFA